MKKTIFGFGLLAVLGGPLHADPRDVAVEGQFGLRSGRFQAAPKSLELWLEEAQLTARSGSFADVGPVGFVAGVNLAMSDMRGDLGPGLSRFSGYRYGPELRANARHPEVIQGKLSAFSSVGYAFGTFEGRGSPNWDDGELPPLFLLGAQSVAPETKAYKTRGAHVSIGVAYDVASNLAVSGTFDAGFETLKGDSTIIAGAREISGRETTSFATRAVLIGASYQR